MRMNKCVSVSQVCGGKMCTSCYPEGFQLKKIYSGQKRKIDREKFFLRGAYNNKDDIKKKAEKERDEGFHY